VIVSLKRDDLPEEYRDRTAKDLRLGHFRLSPELTERADLIVFVEGSGVKFLKHVPGIQSQDSIEVLMHYITSTESATNPLPGRPKRPYRRKKTQG
jgi:hypothetical protein